MDCGDATPSPGACQRVCTGVERERVHNRRRTGPRSISWGSRGRSSGWNRPCSGPCQAIADRSSSSAPRPLALSPPRGRAPSPLPPTGLGPPVEGLVTTIYADPDTQELFAFALIAVQEGVEVWIRLGLPPTF